MGETKSREARMTVHETQPVLRPTALPAARQQQQITTENIYFDEEADYIVMHCAAASNTRVTWTHNGQVINIATAEHIEIFDNGTLVIHEPVEQDEGNYQCTTATTTVANYELNGKTQNCFRTHNEFSIKSLKKLVINSIVWP